VPVSGGGGRRRDGLRSLGDLKGQKIAISGGPGAAGGYLSEIVLQKAGIGLRDMTVVDYDRDPPAPRYVAPSYSKSSATAVR